MFVYCDYISHLTKKALLDLDQEGLIKMVGPIKFDVDAEGRMVSSKKTLEVTDTTNKKYLVTVEEVAEK